MPADSPFAGSPLLVREKQLTAITNISRRSIRRAMAAGRFPIPMKIGGCVVWKYSDLTAWIESGCGAVEGGGNGR